MIYVARFSLLKFISLDSRDLLLGVADGLLQKARHHTTDLRGTGNPVPPPDVSDEPSAVRCVWTTTTGQPGRPRHGCHRSV